MLDFTKQLTVSAALFETYTDCSQRSIAIAQSTKPPIFDVIDIEPLSEGEMREFFQRAFELAGTKVLDEGMLVLTSYSAGSPRSCT